MKIVFWEIVHSRYWCLGEWRILRNDTFWIVVVKFGGMIFCEML